MTRRDARSDKNGNATAAPVRLPLGGLALGTRIGTADGMLPIEHLVPGDLVCTRSGLCSLRAMRVSILHVRPVILGAGSLGHDRPMRDVTVAPGQPVVLTGWRAQTLYNVPFAPVTANRLVDGRHVRRAEAPVSLRVFTPLFDSAEAIFAEGWEFAIFETHDQTA